MLEIDHLGSPAKAFGGGLLEFGRGTLLALVDRLQSLRFFRQGIELFHDRLLGGEGWNWNGQIFELALYPMHGRLGKLAKANGFITFKK